MRGGPFAVPRGLSADCKISIVAGSIGNPAAP
jgi:hypothetical protein